MSILNEDPTTESLRSQKASPGKHMGNGAGLELVISQMSHRKGTQIYCQKKHHCLRPQIIFINIL
jgi:hypothetical protein